MGHGERGAVGLGGVGGGDHERARALAAGLRACTYSRESQRGRGAQPLDGSGERELCAAHALDEVAAPADAERLELGERVVEQREAALDALGEDLLASDDAVALEQELGECAPALARAGGPFGPAAEDPLGERPAALDLSLRAAAPVSPGKARAPDARPARATAGEPRLPPEERSVRASATGPRDTRSARIPEPAAARAGAPTRRW